MVLPSTCILRVANSTPMVDFDSKLNSFLVNRDRRLLFPTPESPMRTTEREGKENQLDKCLAPIKFKQQFLETF